MSEGPQIVRSVAGLRPSHGRLAFSVGVFDGLHLGHAHLLAALVRQARAWDARPAVITFDAHPDAVLRGEAPPLLLDPDERESLLADAGVEVIVVEHFDDRLRTTPYDEFVNGIAARVELAGFVMTPDAAFGHERRGTPDALRALASRAARPFQVAEVPPFSVDGRPVSSSDIRRLVTAGDLAAAQRLLGRPYAVVGTRGRGSGAVSFALPVALPPPGSYGVAVGSRQAIARIEGGGSVVLDVHPAPATERVRLVFEGQSPVRASNPASVGRKPQRS
jgi:riboflavin kinase / FMN adenylyltransferase